MSRFLLHLLTSLLLLASVSGKDQVNIIFIMADDLGYGDLSCYGNQTIKTPHLDRLAAGGVKCTDFHSNGAVCSPTRAALMTGRYQQRSGVPGVITAANHRHHGLALGEWTLGEAMKELGYHTALFGKWHLGYAPKYNPTRQGFDEFKGFVSGNVDYHRHIDQEGYFDWWQQDQLKDESGYLTDLITKHAIDFIQRNKNHPFCLILQHGAPHYPLQGRKTHGFRVKGKTNKNQPKLRIENPKMVYKEMIEVMDEGIGQIIKALETHQLSKKTLVVFCSDNGPARAGSAGPLRGRKGQLTEGGHRVPGIFYWPGQLPAGSECKVPILTMDLLPTFVSVAGGKVKPSRALDGVNVLDALKGKTIQRQPLFWQHGGKTAVRDGHWKFIRGKKSGQLYHLGQDLKETTNLSAKHPERVKKLTQLIDEWKVSVSNKNVKVQPKQ